MSDRSLLRIAQRWFKKRVREDLHRAPLWSLGPPALGHTLHPCHTRSQIETATAESSGASKPAECAMQRWRDRPGPAAALQRWRWESAATACVSCATCAAVGRLTGFQSKQLCRRSSNGAPNDVFTCPCRHHVKLMWPARAEQSLYAGEGRAAHRCQRRGTNIPWYHRLIA